MTRATIAAVAVALVLTSCQGTLTSSDAPVTTSAPGPSASPTPATVPIDVQGRFDGVMRPAQAAVSRSPRMPAGSLVLNVRADGGFGVLNFSNETIYTSGMHAHGVHTLVATTTPAPLPSSGQPGPQVPMGCSGPGTYRWSYDAVHYLLRFTVVSDACVDRALLLGGVLWRLHGMNGR
ncbi:MAG: hypothetical protein QOJ90_35 [Actinomycetota bacterium]|jgi:hypothetical protein|nr:hypothetical protein [Actinomycetota bacterium]